MVYVALVGILIYSLSVLGLRYLLQRRSVDDDLKKKPLEAVSSPDDIADLFEIEDELQTVPKLIKTYRNREALTILKKYRHPALYILFRRIKAESISRKTGEFLKLTDQEIEQLWAFVKQDVAFQFYLTGFISLVCVAGLFIIGSLIVDLSRSFTLFQAGVLFACTLPLTLPALVFPGVQIWFLFTSETYGVI